MSIVDKYVPYDTQFVRKRELVFLNCLAIIVHVLDGTLGTLLVATSHDVKFPVVASLVEYVTGQPGGSFFRTMPNTWFSVSAFWPSIAVEWITAAFHGVYLLALINPFVDDAIRKYVANTSSINALRWVEYGVTATLMTTVGSLAIGISDAYYFVRNLACGVALQACGYVLELLDPDMAGERRVANAVWYIAFVLNSSAVVVLLYQTFASKTHANLWLFVENSVPFALWFNTFGVVAWMAFTRHNQFVDRYFAERWYVILSLSTKFAVFWLSFGTYRKIAETEGYVQKTGVHWDAVRYMAMTLPAAWVLAYWVYDVRVWNALIKEERTRNASKSARRPTSDSATLARKRRPVQNSSVVYV